MGDYRLYYVDHRGRIFAADEIEARSDGDALELARSKAAGFALHDAIELWQADRRVWPPTAKSDAAPAVGPGGRTPLQTPPRSRG